MVCVVCGWVFKDSVSLLDWVSMGWGDLAGVELSLYNV